MAWISSFYLGRPGYETAFDLNPATLRIENAQITAKNRVLSGHMRKWVFRTEFPTITLDGTFFTMAQKDLMESMLTISDTFLSFRVTDGFTRTGEINYPDNSGTTVTIQENSATLLSAAMVAAGAAPTVTISGVFDNVALTGANYWTGGSYADATRTITLGTPVLSSIAVYVTYQYTGWLVNMDRLNWSAQGGFVDVTKYSGWILEGV